MTSAHDCVPSSPATVATRRNRYFTGKFMTADDFATDPEYFLSRHRLHNRLLHGWGIARGLKLIPHPNPECRWEWVVVEPGVALDPLGREVLLCEATPVEVNPGRSALLPAVLFLTYDEEVIEPLPALYAEGPRDPGDREPNRIEERPRFEVVPLDAVASWEWPRPEASPGDLYPEPGEPELWARVALGLIHEGEDGLVLDLGRRRELATAPSPLTRIEAINWPHAGGLSPARFWDEMGGRLEVRFESPLATQDGTTTLDPAVFTVEVGPVQGPRRPVQGDVGLEENGRIAVFATQPRGEGYTREDFNDETLFVTLRCDFLLDGRGLAVDGGHLGGVLPSGRGVPGGLFESWFSLRTAATQLEERPHDTYPTND